jgi:hypothetical protein
MRLPRPQHAALVLVFSGSMAAACSGSTDVWFSDTAGSGGAVVSPAQPGASGGAAQAASGGLGSGTGGAPSASGGVGETGGSGEAPEPGSSGGAINASGGAPSEEDPEEEEPSGGSASGGAPSDGAGGSGGSGSPSGGTGGGATEGSAGAAGAGQDPGPDQRVPLVLNEMASMGSDFVELFNLGSEPFALGGYGVADGNANGPNLTRRFAFPEDAVLEPGGYVVVFAVGDVGVQTSSPLQSPGQCGGLGVSCYRASFGLSSGGETVFLLNPQLLVLSSVAYPAMVQTSYGRLPNGSGSFSLTSQATPGRPNQ